jgi:hypothetical protein
VIFLESWSHPATDEEHHASSKEGREGEARPRQDGSEAQDASETPAAEDWSVNLAGER